MKYCWLDLNTGEFSGSWTQETQDEYINEVIKDKTSERNWKLIQFNCLNDENFEFQNIMKIVTNTKNLKK